MIEIREEREDDVAAIRDVNRRLLCDEKRLKTTSVSSKLGVKFGFNGLPVHNIIRISSMSF